MAIPGFQDFMLPLLQLVADNGDTTKKQYEEDLADLFNLTEEERELKIASGGDLTYRNRIGWAASHLVMAKLLERPVRATIRITDRGRELLRETPNKIDVALLMRYPEYRESRQPKKKPEPNITSIDSIQADSSPKEQLEDAYYQLREALASELLDTVMKASPEFFEKLVVAVLVAMGYGGTREDAGEAIGKSGDGGIDGVIKEDRLGLDSIYIQAKRWEYPVSRPQLQAFAGALMGQNATRGVFITSSDFTSGARDYVKQIQAKIVLINGQELADLMIDYGVGVIDEQTYRVKRVDPEYFGE